MSKLPSGLRYELDYIDIDYESHLIKLIDMQCWSNVLKRRTQHYGHVYKYAAGGSKSSDMAAPIPAFLIDLFKKLRGDGFGSDIELDKLQIIINEYVAGQGIASHIDDPKLFGDWVIGVNLNDAIGMQFTCDDDPPCKIFMKRRSVYEMKADSRYKWQHGILPVKTDKFVNYNGLMVNHSRGRRISITFRYIL